MSNSYILIKKKLGNNIVNLNKNNGFLPCRRRDSPLRLCGANKGKSFGLDIAQRSFQNKQKTFSLYLFPGSPLSNILYVRHPSDSYPITRSRPGTGDGRMQTCSESEGLSVKSCCKISSFYCACDTKSEEKL